MNMLGDMNRYTQYQVANSLPIAAANEGGGLAGIGVGLGAGLTMANVMTNAMRPGEILRLLLRRLSALLPRQAPLPQAAAPAAAADTKFCINCGNQIARAAKFCPSAELATVGTNDQCWLRMDRRGAPCKLPPSPTPKLYAPCSLA